MPKFKIRASEKRTVYGVSIYEITADTAEEAKDTLINNKFTSDNESEQEPVDQWDTQSENYEFIETDKWDIEEL